MAIVVSAAIDSQGATVGARQFNAALASMRSGVENMDRNIGTLANSIRGIATLAVATTFARMGQEAVKAADSYLLLKARIGLLADAGTPAIAVLDGIAKVADRVRVPASELATVYLRNAAAIKQMGKSQEEALAFTEQLAKVVKISGVSATEASAAMLQLGQALSSDRLAGDEFRSVAENLPELLRILQRETGKSAKELRALAEAGALNGKLIVNALSNAKNEIDQKFATVPQTATEAAAVAKDNMIREFSKTAEASGVSKAWADVFNAIKEAMAGEEFRSAMKAIAGLLTGAADGFRAVMKAGHDAKLDIQAFSLAIQETAPYQLFAKALAAIRDGISSLFSRGVDFAGAADDAFRGATGPQSALEKFNARVLEIKENLKAVAEWQTTIVQGAVVKPIEAKSPDTKQKLELGPTEMDKLIEKERLQREIQKARIAGNKTEIEDAQEALELYTKITYEMRQTSPLQAQRLEANIRLTNEIERQTKIVERNREISEGFARTFVDAIKGAVEQGKNLGQTFRIVAARMLESVTQALILEPLIKSMGKSLAGLAGEKDMTSLFSKFLPGFGGGGGAGDWVTTVTPFASGGILNGATPFRAAGVNGVAGEAGPEAIMPLRRGPNGQLGVAAAGGGSQPVVVNFQVDGDATPDTLEKMRRMAEQVFSERSPAIVRQSVGAVRNEHVRDPSYLRR